MSTIAARATGSSTPADDVLGDILREIAVPYAVLKEAKDRRNLVLDIAMEHDAARAQFVSGSVAHGTENKPLEDADCGIKVNRRYEAFRAFGPDSNESKGPEEFIQMFAGFILPRLRRRGYENAEVNLDGNRAIKFELNEAVDIDDWGVVDPYVELILGLTRADGDGLWIPNRRENGWDLADPEHHTWLMTKLDDKPLRVHRAHVLRLAKRAVKRDGVIQGRLQVMCSWNLCALALDLAEEVIPITEALATYFAGASSEIARGLTEDPSPVVEDPINLPPGVTREMAAARLGEMAEIVAAAHRALHSSTARAELEKLYGNEIGAIRSREDQTLKRAYDQRDPVALGTALGASGAHKVTGSDGA